MASLDDGRNNGGEEQNGEGNERKDVNDRSAAWMLQRVRVKSVARKSVRNMGMRNVYMRRAGNGGHMSGGGQSDERVGGVASQDRDDGSVQLEGTEGNNGVRVLQNRSQEDWEALSCQKNGEKSSGQDGN